MYRNTIEHPEYLPEATRKVTDFESGKGMGRIYRVIAGKTAVLAGSGTGRREVRARKFDLGNASTRELCAQLENPNDWWRLTAQRLLLERQDLKAVPRLTRLVKNGQTPEARVHALRTLQGLAAVLDWRDLLQGALQDQHPAVREHAMALSETLLTSDADFASRVALRVKDDPNPRVRFQAALSLNSATGNDALSALVAIAFKDLDSPWTRAAVLSSIVGREDAFLQRMLLEGARKPAAAFPSLMGELSRIVAASASEERLLLLLREFLAWKRAMDLPWQIAAFSGFADGLRLRGRAVTQSSPLMSLAGEDSGNLREQVNDLLRRAGEYAGDTKQPVSTRLAAIKLLTQAEDHAATNLFESLIEPQQPAEIQIMAIRALAQTGGAQSLSSLLQPDRWNNCTPTVRDVVLSLLMANPNSLAMLLTAIESGEAPAWTIPAERRVQLLNHRDERIRNRASVLFKDLIPGDRMKAYEEAKFVLALKGDGRNGHAVFQKNCISCHTFAGEGKMVGPDLTGIRNQPAEALLLHIVVPEQEIMPIYTAYAVETHRGEVFTGLLTAETPGAITLVMAQGIEQQIPRTDVAAMTPSRFSLMPQELERAMTKQELADLLAFLKGQ
jgi:putative heme-binding domain-containing protein